MKALANLVGNYQPNSLQRAAIARIEYFRRELNKHGYAMRSGMELEFATEDKEGRLRNINVSLQNLNNLLLNDSSLPYLQHVMADNTAGLEAIVGDDLLAGGEKPNPRHFSPIGVALTTASLRKCGLKRALLQTGCYTNPSMDGLPLRPVFAAYPASYYDSNFNMTGTDNTCGLHVNVSLYDKEGRNAFSEDPEFAKHCAQTLVHVQREAALAFLPKKNSLRRLGRNANYAVPAGLGMQYLDPDEERRTYSSVHIRGGIRGARPDDLHVQYHDTRIENRLPGADADPFVAMAVTMAALVLTVRERSKGSRSERTNPTYRLPRTTNDMQAEFSESTQLRELLGPDLHKALTADAASRHGSKSL